MPDGRPGTAPPDRGTETMFPFRSRDPFEVAGICPCGVVDDLDDRGLCRVCAAAPHDRECICDECDAYWADVERRSRV
jgi:hypothetical protein